MFERCTESARRAIFFARAITLFTDAPTITSLHLLGGLLWDDDSRAQTIFGLREYFPLYSGRPWKFATLPEHGGVTATQPNGPPLEAHCKMILAWSEIEATRLGDYWIDTEHWLLGILRVRPCTGARYLETAGLTLDAARKTIQENKPSRPDYGRVPRWWRIKARLFRWF